MLCSCQPLLPVWQLSVEQAMGFLIGSSDTSWLEIGFLFHRKCESCRVSSQKPRNNRDFSLAYGFFFFFIFGIVVPFSSRPPLPWLCHICHVDGCTNFVSGHPLPVLPSSLRFLAHWLEWAVHVGPWWHSKPLDHTIPEASFAFGFLRYKCEDITFILKTL